MVPQATFISIEFQTKEAELDADFAELMEIAEKYTRMSVRTNADTPEDAKRAREFGAKGIGLTRTEHMFFEGARIKAMREMILSSTTAGRKKPSKNCCLTREPTSKEFWKLWQVMVLPFVCSIHLCMNLFLISRKCKKRLPKKWESVSMQ